MTPPTHHCEALELAHAAAWGHILDARDAAAAGRVDLARARADLALACAALPASRVSAHLRALEGAAARVPAR